MYFFDDCVTYRSEINEVGFPRQCDLPIKPRQKRRLGESSATLSEGSASSATAEGRAKMQRQAISLGVVAPVVLARRRVAATPAATSSRAPPADQKSHFLGRRPSHGASAPPRGPPSLRAVADAAPARAPRGRGRGGKGGRGGGGGGGGSGGSSADVSTSARASKASSPALATRAISSQSSTPTATRSTPSTPPPPSTASPRTPRATPRANPSRPPRPSRRSWTSSAPISAA